MHFDIPLRENEWSVVTGTYAQTLSAVWRVAIRVRIFDNTSLDQSNGIDNIMVRKRQDVYPVSYLVSEGEQLYGDLASLNASDDNRLTALSDSATLGTAVGLDATAPWLQPLDLTFTCETSAERLGLSQAISLYNYNSGTWVTVGGRVATSQDVSDSFIFTNNPSQWIGPSGELKAKVRWQPINDEDPSQDGWATSIDFAKWRIL